MSQIVNWEYYSSLFQKVKEEEFIRLESLAEREVQLVIGWIRWSNIVPEDFYYEQLQYCICRVVNALAENEKSGKGKGVSSVSNDGYSESYTLQTEQQVRFELQSSIKAWLSGTGLVGAY